MNISLTASKVNFLWSFKLLVFALLVPFSSLAQSNSSYFLVDDFEKDSVSALPDRWYTTKIDAKLSDFSEERRALYDYGIAEENGNRFLRYEGSQAKHLSFPFFEEIDIDLFETPILSWQWRIHDVPENASENSRRRNDVAASIYVVFEMRKILFTHVPKSIKYTWSASLEEGTELSKFYGNQKIIVLGSGTPDSPDWVTFERNIVEDFQRLFGKDPPSRPLIFMVLSDGDSTGDYVKADYDNIFLKSN